MASFIPPVVMANVASLSGRSGLKEKGKKIRFNIFFFYLVCNKSLYFKKCDRLAYLHATFFITMHLVNITYTVLQTGIK